MATSPRRTTPYIELTRAQWSAAGERAPLPLTAAELTALRGLGDVTDLTEVREVHLPLVRLLQLHIEAAAGLRSAVGAFLHGDADPGAAERRAGPFVIAVAGSVAVGKSTISRLLRALLERGPGRPSVALVTTDGFLLPTDELRRRGLLARKGFPESYDRRALTRFVAEVKSGRPEVSAPVYSHLTYDIVPGERLVVRRPDILILEGLNVLQSAPPGRVGLADHFDFSLYVDARPADIRAWYLDRFLRLRATAFRDPRSYFRKYAELPEETALAIAGTTWRTVNEPNLVANIAPTRARATLVLRKGPDHAVRAVRLRHP
ncbi:type I pantothenate kinase [Streptomyces sp. RFCAC02]|uniref:type I pantothenate kinase n=1 Tax=Streptomyces sp. RFCAC02 TaxID=2499143 RepID=UPI001F0DBBE8|nr:type I pantothenate kinase [Streptomyces sp. RFCAC02]